MILAGGASTVSLIDGLTFAISDTLGDICGNADGFIADDTRHLSRLAVRVDGAPPRSLGAAQLSAATARFRGFVPPGPGHADASLEVERRRTVASDGLEDEVILRWWAATPGRVAVAVELDADFVDIFAIRGVTTGSAAAHPPAEVATTPGEIRFSDAETGLATSVMLTPPPDSLDGGVARWALRLRRGEPWRLRVSVEAGAARPREVGDGGGGPGPRSRVEVETRPIDLGRGCRRALTDLDALSMPDREAPGRRLWPRASRGSSRSSAGTASSPATRRARSCRGR